MDVVTCVEKINSLYSNPHTNTMIYTSIKCRYNYSRVYIIVVININRKIFPVNIQRK